MITFEKSDIMLQDIMIERGLGEVIVFYAHFLFHHIHHISTKRKLTF